MVKLYVAENQAVKAGDPLFEIDARPYQLALDKAEAQLRLASQSVSQESANWVKVTQRVPVRIRVLDPDPRFPLRIGTTATVKVDVAQDLHRRLRRRIGAVRRVAKPDFVPDTPKKQRRMDWPGLGLLLTGIAGLQYAIDRGNQQDWFAAADIRISALLGLAGTVGFVAYSLHSKGHALFDIRIFADRNFGTACFVVAALGLGMFGGMVIQPILLERLLDYPIVTTDLVMAPRGIATAVSMLVVGRIGSRIDARILVAAGMLLSAGGSYAMTNYSLDVDKFWVIWPAMVQGFGLGLIFVPLSTIAYTTLPRARMAEAAGLYSLVRTMGSAIGISVITTMMSREGQVVWNELGGHIRKFNPAVLAYLQSLHLSPTDPKALAIIAGQVGEQAEIVAMLDMFKLIAWSFLFMLPLVLFLRRSGRKADAASAPLPPAE